MVPSNVYFGDNCCTRGCICMYGQRGNIAEQKKSNNNGMHRKIGLGICISPVCEEWNEEHIAEHSMEKYKHNWEWAQMQPFLSGLCRRVVKPAEWERIGGINWLIPRAIWFMNEVMVRFVLTGIKGNIMLRDPALCDIDPADGWIGLCTPHMVEETKSRGWTMIYADVQFSLSFILNVKINLPQY